MKQIFLIIKREYLIRVKKKSFLLATILTPLLFPAIIFGVAYFATRDSGDSDKAVFVLDESGYFQDAFSDSKYEYTYLSGDLETAKEKFQEDDAYGLIHIPIIDLEDASKTFYENFSFYSKTNPGLQIMDDIEDEIRTKLEAIKLDKSGLDPELIKSLRVRIDLDSFNLSDTGEAKESNSKISSAIGYVFGFLIYMFIFVYGSQIMQSVLDEKSSRIVEVIVSSVKPFQLMMGKILGVGAVGFTQLLIWIVLMFTLSAVGISVLGGGAGMIVMADQVPQQVEMTDTQEMISNVQGILANIPVVTILISFLFYFLGAYFLYGALYAAVGASVDSLQDAQQFMFPIIIPLIAGIVSLSFVLQDPNSSLSVALSMIPLTSPIIMMARIPFGVPTWQLLLSMLFLIAGFIGTTWVAGRIYRVGILMHGAKVNWKIIAKWFTMKI
jgi:ABC-2 type transport system permease protein